MLKKNVKKFLAKYLVEDLWVFVSKAEAKKIVECECKNARGIVLSSDELMSDLTMPISLCSHQFQEVLNLVADSLKSEYNDSTCQERSSVEQSEVKQIDLSFKGAIIHEILTEKESALINKIHWRSMHSAPIPANQLQLLNVDHLVLLFVDREGLIVVLALLHTNRLKCFTTQPNYLIEDIFQLFNLTDVSRSQYITLTSTTISKSVEYLYPPQQEKQYDYDEVIENIAI